MTIQLAYKQLLAQLYQVYDDREAANIAGWVIEHVTGQNKLNRILYKDLPVSEDQQQLLFQITSELLQHRPVQYVLNECWFDGMKLYVDETVLIPRPETEELVDWIVNDWRQIAVTVNKPRRLLDMGTGSGCLPIALKKQLPAYSISAIDISEEALRVADRNAQQQKVQIQWMQADMLQPGSLSVYDTFDVIVSNPPYIKRSEAAAMAANVLRHEPALALFVPDDDALVFYRAIARFAAEHLQPEGAVYVEINEALGQQVSDLFSEAGFTQVVLRKDLQGKDRMIKALKRT